MSNINVSTFKKSQTRFFESGKFFGKLLCKFCCRFWANSMWLKIALDWFIYTADATYRHLLVLACTRRGTRRLNEFNGDGLLNSIRNNL